MPNNQPTSVFSNWEPFAYRSEITAIVIIFLLFTGLSIFYFLKMRKQDPSQPPKGLVLLIFLFVQAIRNMVADVMGVKYVKFTPYIMTLFCYIMGSNLISLIGFNNPTALTTVTFSMGVVTVFGTVIFSIRFQKWAYLYNFTFKFSIYSTKKQKKVLIPYFFNPFGVADIFAPLMSISLRLWANVFAGAIIIILLYAIPLAIFGINAANNPGAPPLLIGGLVAIPFHGFFDFAIGIIQTFVFTILTISYWGNQIQEEKSQPATSNELPTPVVKLVNTNTV